MAEEKRFAKEREKIESFPTLAMYITLKKISNIHIRPMRALLKK